MKKQQGFGGVARNFITDKLWKLIFLECGCVVYCPGVVVVWLGGDCGGGEDGDGV